MTQRNGQRRRSFFVLVMFLVCDESDLMFSFVYIGTEVTNEIISTFWALLGQVLADALAYCDWLFLTLYPIERIASKDGGGEG